MFAMLGSFLDPLSRSARTCQGRRNRRRVALTRCMFRMMDVSKEPLRVVRGGVEPGLGQLKARLGTAMLRAAGFANCCIVLALIEKLCGRFPVT